MYINFFYDSFASIQVATPIEKSTISLINRDIRTNDPFTIHEPLNIISGMPAQDPRSFSGKPCILLGSSMSLIQGLPMLGKMMKQGLMTRVNKENREQGGVDGRVIRVIVKNDDYYPPKTRDNIREFLERGIDITLLQIGTPTLISYLDLVKEGKLIALFPVTGAPILYTPEYDRVISFRASYDDEVRALINYIYGEIGDRSFAFLYQNDSYGKGPLESAHKSLERFGIKKWTDISYPRGSTNLKEEATKIKEASYDALGLFSTAQPTQELLRLISVNILADKDLFGISPLAEESFRQFIKKHNVPITFGAVVPNPNTSKLEIVEEYRKEMIKSGYRVSAYALEGYLATTILIDAMKKIKGPINQNSVTDMIKSIKNLDLQGLKLNYNPARSDLCEYVYLEMGENREWVRTEISSLYKHEQ
jgi:ABC-type branched-subunit amino acid transport system substrate-binding protein